MGKINYRTDEENKKLKQIDELVGSNKNLSNQINNFNSQLDTKANLNEVITKGNVDLNEMNKLSDPLMSVKTTADMKYNPALKEWEERKARRNSMQN